MADLRARANYIKNLRFKGIEIESKDLCKRCRQSLTEFFRPLAQPEKSK